MTSFSIASMLTMLLSVVSQVSVSAQLAEAPMPRLDQLVAQLNARQAPSLQLSGDLEELLRDEPQLIPGLPARLLEAGTSSDTADTIILALEVIGTPEAQRALGDVFADPRQRHLDRLRAVIAQGAVAAPTETGVASLWSASSVRVDSERVDISNTAILSLGITTNTLREKSKKRSLAMRGGLVSSLHRGNDLSERCMWLKALGNTKDATLSTEAATYLFDESAPVRASAAQSLGLMGSDASVDLLATLLVQEARGAVRATMVSSMRRLQSTPHSLKTVHERVMAESDPHARAVMVQYLGEHLTDVPEARPTLEHMLSNDPTKRIRLLAAFALHS